MSIVIAELFFLLIKRLFFTDLKIRMMSFYCIVFLNANLSRINVTKNQLSALVAITYSRADALPSALEYFTAEFGMGSGGTTPV